MVISRLSDDIGSPYPTDWLEVWVTNWHFPDYTLPPEILGKVGNSEILNILISRFPHSHVEKLRKVRIQKILNFLLLRTCLLCHCQVLSTDLPCELACQCRPDDVRGERLIIYLKVLFFFWCVNCESSVFSEVEVVRCHTRRPLIPHVFSFQSSSSRRCAGPRPFPSCKIGVWADPILLSVGAKFQIWQKNSPTRKQEHLGKKSVCRHNHPGKNMKLFCPNEQRLVELNIT